MKKLKFAGNEYIAESIVKNSDSIVGYNGDSEVFSFSGISDHSLFTLEEGQEWDIDDEEFTENTIASLLYELMMKDLMVQQMQNDQAGLVYQLMMKGVL